MADAIGAPLIGLRQSNVADPAAVTSSASGIAITYTTDDPGITPDGTITIADGDLFPAAEGLIALEETSDQLNKLNADVVAIHAAVVSILNVLEEHGFMTAS